MQDVIKTLPVDQVSIDDTMITVHDGLINTEAEMDALNRAAK